MAGITGIFLAIPVVAILTVSYRHWLEHRGSEGLADLLEATPAAASNSTSPPASAPAGERHPVSAHPGVGTTPDEMARARPDLTTGELKLPVQE